MKKMLWMLLSAAMAMASVTSCSKDETASDSTQTIEATVELPEQIDAFSGTRTMIYDAEDGGIELWWGASEAIGVYGTRLTNKKFTGTNKYRDAASTSFSGATLFSSPKYAYYPYDAANNSNAQTAIKGNLPSVQDYSTIIRRLNYDYKIGTYSSWSFSGSKFYFSNIVNFTRIQINATGTALEGDKLERVQMVVNTAEGQPRQICGEFTFDLTKDNATAITSWTAAEGTNTMTLALNDTPTLSSGKTVEGFLTVGPTIKAGDVLSFVITTDKHIASFSRTTKIDFEPAQLIKFPFTLSKFSDMAVEGRDQYVEPEPEEGVECVLNSFKFTVADNPGKILSRNFTHNSSFTLSVGANKTEEVATVDEENKKITLSVPYLNNRNLVPAFEIPEGTQLIYEGGEIISGETVVDFATYKQVAVINSVGDAVVYDIELTNSGLPVVVVNQQTGIGHSETNSKYTAASNAWYAATGTGWLAKDADWEMTEGVDTFMVYNADGTSAVTDKNGAVVESPIDASTRLRGNVTQQMPKKAFAVKLDKKSGVLGMPAHKRWVLLANWKDRTLMRNAVANGIAKVFRDNLQGGIPWNPSGEFVELVYNGVHVGTYYLCEQIKIDGNRLDIADPYDPEEGYSGNPADYGYLMESDDGYDEAWQFTTANYVPFLLKDDANDDMLTYAAGFVRGIEDQLYAGNYTEAFKKMDLTSFVDFWLIQELMMNSEVAHPKSCYSYINGGVMYAGPLWDFDWNTLPVSSSYSENGYSFTESMLEDAMASSGWFKSYRCFHKKSGYPSAPKNESDGNYIWYPMLVKSAEFKALAAERWNAVKAAVQAYVETEIPKMKTRIAASEALNNKMWPVDSGSTAWGSKRYSTYGIGGGFCGDEAKSFSDAVSTMQSTLKSRINGMSYVSNQSWPNVEYKAE